MELLWRVRAVFDGFRKFFFFVVCVAASTFPEQVVACSCVGLGCLRGRIVSVVSSVYIFGDFAFS